MCLMSCSVHIIYLFFFIASLFESFDVSNFKYDAMKYDFAYLCDLFLNNDEHFIESNMSIFDIYSINIEPFNMGIDENPRILHISKDVTPEERRELEKNIHKILEGIRLDIRRHAWHR